MPILTCIHAFFCHCFSKSPRAHPAPFCWWMTSYKFIAGPMQNQTNKKKKKKIHTYIYGQFRMKNFVSEDRSEIIFWTYPAHIHTSYPLKTWGHVIQFTDQRLCLNWNYGICHNWNSQMHSQPIRVGVKGGALWRTFDKTTPLFSGKCSGNHWLTAVHEQGLSGKCM